ncbi:MAG: sigma-54 dependent transcriptional regulator [Acidobacteriia bacterium]|nr:sigma-54 dependent transcriptional regulator [Terriglobia bacterium]
MATAKNDYTILLGEDDPEVRGYLDMALRCEGYRVMLAEDGEELLDQLRTSQTPISAILLDIVMPRKDGFEALEEIRRWDNDIPVIMISGMSAPPNVMEALRKGANDFIAKPLNPDDLRNSLKTVLDARTPSAPVPKPLSPSNDNDQIFFGNTARVKKLHNRLGQIAWSEAPVLIQGETGVGKEVIARELHAQSPRAKRPFLKLNCAALPSELVESELFGYERGAFTGAFQKKLGMFEVADSGTIFLDEIGDMDFKLQAKLLQVLQDHQFQRLGGKETVKVDVRVIAATHRDLPRAIEENSFREDLYYRLKVISVEIPPLRERKEDIPALAEFLAKKHSAPGVSIPNIPPRLKEILLRHDWPGNIRELENVIRNFLVLGDMELIEADLRGKVRPPAVEAPVAAAGPAPAADTGWAGVLPRPVEVSESGVSILEQVAEAKRQAEREVIVAALEAHNWQRKETAHALKIDYKAFLYKLKKLSIRKEKVKLSPRKRPAVAAYTRAAVAVCAESLTGWQGSRCTGCGHPLPR